MTSWKSAKVFHCFHAFVIGTAAKKKKKNFAQEQAPPIAELGDRDRGRERSRQMCIRIWYTMTICFETCIECKSVCVRVCMYMMLAHNAQRGCYVNMCFVCMGACVSKCLRACPACTITHLLMCT